MREIEFRGKRKSDGRWLYGDLITGLFFSATDNTPLTYILDPDIEKDYDHLGDFDDIDCEVIPETVGQFAGLTDINGEKIFEGDVVDEIIGRFGGNEEVVFKNGEFNTKSRMFNKAISMLVVVGNVHDNPELLEGKPSAAEEGKK